MTTEKPENWFMDMLLPLRVAWARFSLRYIHGVTPERVERYRQTQTETP